MKSGAWRVGGQTTGSCGWVMLDFTKFAYLLTVLSGDNELFVRVHMRSISWRPERTFILLKLIICNRLIYLHFEIDLNAADGGCRPPVRRTSPSESAIYSLMLQVAWIG